MRRPVPARPLGRTLLASALLVAALVHPAPSSANEAAVHLAQKAPEQLTFPKEFQGDVFKDGLEKFRKTKEGQQEEKMVAGETGVTIEIEMYESDDAYGDSKVLERDPKTSKPTKKRIRIAKNDPGDADNVAETIKHELRHIEIFDDIGTPGTHRGVDDGTDAALGDFLKELKALPIVAAPCEVIAHEEFWKPRTNLAFSPEMASPGQEVTVELTTDAEGAAVIRDDLKNFHVVVDGEDFGPGKLEGNRLILRGQLPRGDAGAVEAELYHKDFMFAETKGGCLTRAP